ncbi:MAG: SAM-dependent methyltransferase [bacterium]
MQKLVEIIREEIVKEGEIPFSRFMELALYHPRYGYYRKGMVPIGKLGDYYTSPTVHKLFGFLIGRQIKEIIEYLDLDKITLVEAGAGRGHLAGDIGEYFSNYAKELVEKLELIIIEPHQIYREIQYRETKSHFKRIEFLDTIDDLSDFNGVFYSNELFDAFPVDIVEFDSNRVYQIYVSFEGSSFVEKRGALTEEVRDFLSSFEFTFKEKFRTEVSHQAATFYSKVTEKLQKGAVLTIDYGYNFAEYLSSTRNRGTLMCYYRHQAFENPYVRVGGQDITAHVNFSVLRKIGEKNGLITEGYNEQQYFLMGCGFVEEVERLKGELTQKAFEEEMQKIKALIMPGGMGTTFKFFLQSKNLSAEKYCGFSYRNVKDGL